MTRAPDEREGDARATVVILTKVPGAAPVKTRLHAALGAEGAERLALDMLGSTAAVARRLDPTPVVAYSPPDAPVDGLRRAVGPCELMPLASRTGTACLAEALARADRGLPLIALGCDAPDLPEALVRKALDATSRHDLALVPTLDGGFSCLAVARPLAGLAEAFRFGSGDACEALLAYAAERGWSALRLGPWPDVDTPADLAELLARGWRPIRGDPPERGE